MTASGPLAPGEPAPYFQLTNQRGQMVALDDSDCAYTVLYFYPKALTPGCTVQAEGVASAEAEFSALNTRVLGISPDAVPRLIKFSDKYCLNFDLLSDADRSVAKQYGVWGPKKFMGRETLGIVRTTFVIDREQIVRAVITPVKTKTHAEQVLSVVRSLIKTIV